MIRQSGKTPRTKLRHKILLPIFGTVLLLVLLETGFRLAGAIITRFQENRNSFSPSKTDAYRILCLGESTTAGQYPAMLEKILNEKNIGIGFKVIDKGIVGANTDVILSNLPGNLDTYRPQMAVVMMGVNDLGEYLPSNRRQGAGYFLEQLRVYKLISWLNNAIKEKRESMAWKSKRKTTNPMKKLVTAALTGIDGSCLAGLGHMENGEFAQAEKLFRTLAQARKPENDWLDSAVGWNCIALRNFSQAREMFARALAINPGNPWAQTGMGWVHLTAREFILAQEMFEKALCTVPENDWAYSGMGWNNREQGKPGVKELFEKALRFNPDNSLALSGLGWSLWEEGHYIKAENLFTKAAVLNPQNSMAFLGLAWCAEQRGDMEKAGKLFRQAIEAEPLNDWTYPDYGFWHIEQNRFAEAGDLFSKALQLNPGNYWAYFGQGLLNKKLGKINEAKAAFKKGLELKPGGKWAYDRWIAIQIAELYKNTGEIGQAMEIFRKASQTDPSNGWSQRLMQILSVTGADGSENAAEVIPKIIAPYTQSTRSNYWKLKSILESRGIKLVCVQYPLRDSGQLRALFPQTKGIVFVDTRDIFKKRLMQVGYDKLFIDMFAGDFGHCTTEGNLLLAQVIADSIIRELSPKLSEKNAGP